jgi:hypothetical protein
VLGHFADRLQWKSTINADTATGMMTADGRT